LARSEHAPIVLADDLDGVEVLVVIYHWRWRPSRGIREIEREWEPANVRRLDHQRRCGRQGARRAHVPLREFR